MALTEKHVSPAGSGTGDGSSEANSRSWANMIGDINAGGTAGNRYNYRGSIARTTTTDTISGSGSSTSPVIIRGCTTTITDGYQGRTSSNGALVTTNFGVVTYTSGILNITGSWIILESLDISGARSGAQISGPPNSAITRCKVANSSTNAAAIGVTCQVNTVLYDNDILLTGGSGGVAAVNTNGNCRIVGNRMTGGPINGITIGSATHVVAIENLIYASGGIGIAVTNVNSIATLFGNTTVGGTGDGIDIVTGSLVLHFIANNMITDNGGYGIDGVSAANAIFASHNRTRDNTAGADNSATDWLAATKYSHVTTDTGGASTDYTNSGSGDYTLISASPAKGVGHFSYRSIGALQRQEVGGSPRFGLAGAGPAFRGVGV